MAIICISRGSASGGRLLAEGLADRLGYRQVSREDILKHAANYGVGEDELLHVLLDPPSFWERASHKRARYLAYFRLALCEEVREDRVIYHGNAGHLLLPPQIPALRIRLVAPLEFRQRMLLEREGMQPEPAREYIRKVDEQRRRWTQFLYGVDPLDPLLYDLVINLHLLDVQGAVDLAAAAAQRPEFSLDEKMKQVLANHHLACRAEVALASDARTAKLDVKVTVEQGVAHLAGKLHSTRQVEDVIAVVKQVPGIEHIERENLDAPPLLV